MNPEEQASILARKHRLPGIAQKEIAAAIKKAQAAAYDACDRHAGRYNYGATEKLFRSWADEARKGL